MRAHAAGVRIGAGGAEIPSCGPEKRIAVASGRGHLEVTAGFCAGLIDALYRCMAERV